MLGQDSHAGLWDPHRLFLPFPLGKKGSSWVPGSDQENLNVI